MTPKTDAPYNDAPNTDDDYAASSKYLILYSSLKRKLNPSQCLN